MNTPFDWIDEFAPRLYFMLGGGVEDWFEAKALAPKLAIASTGRLRASAIYDLAAQRGRQAFADLPNRVKVIEAYETISLYFVDHDITMRIHRADNLGRIHPPNATSRSHEAYYQQNLFSDASADVRGATLNCCYRLNMAHSALDEVVVSYQVADDVVWSKTLPPPPADDRFSLVSPQTPPSVGPDVREAEEA